MLGYVVMCVVNARVLYRQALKSCLNSTRPGGKRTDVVSNVPRLLFIYISALLLPSAWTITPSESGLPHCSRNHQATADLVVLDVVAFLGTGCGGMLTLIVPLTWKCCGKLFGAPLALKALERCLWVAAISVLLVECVWLVTIGRRLVTVVLAGVGPVLGQLAEFQRAQLTLEGSSRGTWRVCALVLLQALEESKALPAGATLVPGHGA